jgi:hypothetical protein
MFNRTLLSTAILVTALSIVAFPTQATNLLGSTTSATISGTTFGFGQSAMPWTAEVYSGPNACLRLAVTVQATDLEMTVVAPNGNVYRDDDSGGSLRPLVKINPTPNNGWYTVSINNFAGNAVSANFTLTLQRLGLNNASCLPATVVRSSDTLAPKPREANPVETPNPGDAGYY